jgi:hypothetical protein
LDKAVRSCTNSSRDRCTACKPCCSRFFSGASMIFGRTAASATAKASFGSVFRGAWPLVPSNEPWRRLQMRLTMSSAYRGTRQTSAASATGSTAPYQTKKLSIPGYKSTPIVFKCLMYGLPLGFSRLPT